MRVDDNVPFWLSRKASQHSWPIRPANYVGGLGKRNASKFASDLFSFFEVPCTCQDSQDNHRNATTAIAKIDVDGEQRTIKINQDSPSSCLLGFRDFLILSRQEALGMEGTTTLL